MTLPKAGEGAAISRHYEEVGRPGHDGKFGRIAAMNLGDASQAWAYRKQAPASSGVLATAGGLVFAGFSDGNIEAIDLTTGQKLWTRTLTGAPGGAPGTYMTDGVQYIAVPTGRYPMPVGLRDKVPPAPNDKDGASAIWIFRLKD